MSDICETKIVEVEIQENGLIYLGKYAIARLLPEIKFDHIKLIKSSLNIGSDTLHRDYNENLVGGVSNNAIYGAIV